MPRGQVHQSAEADHRPRVYHPRLSAFICGLVLIGCAPKMPIRPQPYTGPTLPLMDVVAGVNANNAKLKTLWSYGYFDCTIVQKNPDSGKTSSDDFNADLILMYRPSDDLRILASKPGFRLFDIGTNRDTFWMIVKPAERMWWGEYAKMPAGGDSRIPVQPNLLLQVLGVSMIEPDLLAQPAPVMRFNPDASAYMLTWQVKEADRWIAQKEVWYDVKTLLPKSVFLYDENGRIVLRAHLTAHKPVEIEGTPPEARPMVATQYRLYFPDTGSKMYFRLDDLKAKDGIAPNDRSFTFPGVEKAGVKESIRIDQGP